MKKTLLTVLLSLAFLFTFSGKSRAQDFVTFGLTAQAAACPTNPGNISTSTSAVTLATVNAGGATFTIGSTAFSGTVSFFGSGDGGTTWQALNVTPSNSTTAVTTATVTGLWQANVAAYTHVCMVVTAFSSGTVTATIRKSTVSARAGGGGGGGGSGTVTSVATTGPITGGTFTTSGTIACATCVTSAAALTSTAIVTGAGLQAEQTPSATSTLSAAGNLAIAGSVSTGGATATFGTGGGISMNEGTAATGAAGTDICYADSTTHSEKCSYNNGTFGVVPNAVTAPVTLSNAGNIGCATCATTTNGGAISGTAPVTVSAAGVIACAICATTTNGGAISFDKSATGLINPTADATFTYINTSVSGLTLAGTAPASSAGAGTAASTLFNVNAIIGGASTGSATTAGAGSAPSIVAGAGGSGAGGTNAIGGAGGSIALTAGAGGASGGTAINSNGGSINMTVGSAGTGGSGTAGKAGVVSVTGPTAGFVYLTQGSAPTTANTNIPANTIIDNAPVSVTAYSITRAGAAATGLPHYANASNVITETISAVNLASADVTGLLPINDVGSATGAIATIADGNNPLTINCALTSGTTCLTTGETTAATTAGAVEYQITTLTTSTAIPLQLTQGANGPASANAPALLNVSAAAAGGLATASQSGFVGAPITFLTGAGSAGGATTGTGGTGGAYNLTTGNGGAAGGNTANPGGQGGAINETTGNGIVGAATGGGGAAGVYQYTGGTGGAGGATSGTGGAGGDFLVSTGTGGAATAGSTTGRGGNATFTLGSAGGTGTAGAPGQMRIAAGTTAGANTTPFINLTGTWNTTGVVDAGIFENVTNTASGTGSLLLDLQLAGASELKLEKTGLLTAANIIQSTVGTQVVSGADYTNSTTTPSTVFSWTLPATAAAKNYRYTCDIMWESTNTTLTGPQFGVSISAAPTQLTSSNSVQNTLAGADINGYISNTTTGHQNVGVGTAAGVTNTNYWAKIWGTIEGAPVAGSTFIIDAAALSNTTSTLNIRRGSGCTLN